MKALTYLKLTYPGFEEFQYEAAIDLGGEDNFEDITRQLVNVPYPPYVERSGQTYHQFFLDRAKRYFENCRYRKNTYNHTW